MNDIEKYEKIEEVIESTIRPYLVADGGDIELDLVKGNEVVVSFQGACGSCPSSAGGTLRGIERALRQSVDPDIVVIPTNAYQPPTGGAHPFGGRTYEEEIAERNKGEY
jgi:Fe-S cluster biogenesis protein NfuA